MRNTVFLFTTLLTISQLVFAAPKIQQVEPLCWWTEMETPLTLMFHGEDLQDAKVSVQQVLNGKAMCGECLGLIPRSQHNAESPNYLFVDFGVFKAGVYRITLAKGKKKASYDYVIAERRKGSRERESFTSADLVYLIMSDRFVDGDESNNSTNNTREKANKSNVDGRWGGDIQGIINSFDHISQLGATAIWATPLLCDDEEAWSYHGYACSDYYHIDPR